MRFIELGATDTIVPVIGQGGTEVGKDPSIDHEYNIRYAIGQGMTLIDTAENYGNGLSEETFGKAIKNIRDNVILATKVSPENLSYDDLIRSAENSLKRLSVDYIDLYQIHWPNRNIDIHGTMRALEKLYSDGKIARVGVSNFLPMEIEEAHPNDCLFKGFVSNQVEYNLFDRFAENLIIPYCKKNHLSVICYCPLDRGRVCSGKNLPYLETLAKKYDKTPYQIALNWLVSQDVIVVPYSTKLEHIKANAQASDFNMDDEDFDTISRTVYGEIQYVKVDDIRVNDGGFGNRKVYKNVEEAKANKLDMQPSPEDLSKFLSSLSDEEIRMIKPIRAVRLDDGKFDLIEGRSRYWGWVIAFGSGKDIPIYIVD